MKLFSKMAMHIFLVLVLSASVYAQHIPSKERGDVKYRTSGTMEGNQIRTTILNFGMSGRQGGQFPDQIPYEWPKNTGKMYLAMEGLWVGSEIMDSTGGSLKVVEVYDYRQDRDGTSWNFEPVPGYYNNNREKRELANSEDQTTWPDFWPDKMADSSDQGWAGQWNGYFGKGVRNADMEMFYRAADNNYDRYNYQPDDTDPARRGLGIVFDVRALAWSQFLVEDVLYLLHTIKNDGTKNLDKVAVTIWYADFVGGDGDSQDDWSEFDLIEDIGWSRDKDNAATKFGSDPVGAIALAFLETPGNSVDRVDNDGDGEVGGKKITTEMIAGENPENLIDDNGNGLIDENETHTPFGIQIGVTYADNIDQNGNAEANSPVITQTMIDQAAGVRWRIWPALDAAQAGRIHIINLEQGDLGKAFADGIDNDNASPVQKNIENNSPLVTTEMVTAAAADPFGRAFVNGMVLYAVDASDVGLRYADGIDNDGDGAIDEGIDEGIDEMIDESRNNGIDDDGDWFAITDDHGLDGSSETMDVGSGDNIPTPGRNGLPGEPNIDVTDVSETDQIGITNAQYEAAGSVNLGSASDNYLWNRFMKPGSFYNPQVVKTGEYDLFISSSYFPLRAGQTEPMSLSIIFANGPKTDANGVLRWQEVLRKKARAEETYANDYQFANAPITPTLTAIPGNNRITLYWDDAAEKTFDAYIANIGGNGADFEGYRIYRSSDPAFEDAQLITTGYGIKQFKLPIKQFDVVDGYKGFDSTGFNGVHFFMGDDTGLQHSWVDTTVQNGFTYYYAITSYDIGFPAGEIMPSESPIRVSIQPDGTVKLGANVARVTPDAAAAGFVPASLGNITSIAGSSTGKIGYDILNPDLIKEGNVYNIIFEDTLKIGRAPAPDTLTTKNFTLINMTEQDTIISKSTRFNITDEQPVIDGFKLTFQNESRVEVDLQRSSWNDASIVPFVFEKYVDRTIKGQENPNDYVIEFGEIGIGTSDSIRYGRSNTLHPPKAVNFRVKNLSTDQYIPFGFIELNGTDGTLSADSLLKDRIAFYETNAQGQKILTWMFYLSSNPKGTQRIPQNNDTAYIFLKKPFLETDIYSFTAKRSTINTEEAKVDLENVKVVPNPYVASAQWEPKNPYASGRGPRSIHFNHLPTKCTIRIFTINGELVDVIEHESVGSNGTANWDMLTKDNLAVAYGVYVYHIEAPGIGEKTGKFAIIK